MNRKTVFKKVSVLALALSMTMTTSAYTLVMPVLASEETTLKTEVQITDLTVKSGLKKTDLSFTLPENADSALTYKVYRGTKVDELSEIGTASVSEGKGTFTDTDSVTDKLYFYRIQAGDASQSVASEVQYSQTAAGMDSIANAPFYKDTSKIGFDNSTLVELTPEEISTFRDMDKPTIFVKAAPKENVTHTQMFFMAKDTAGAGGNANRIYFQLSKIADNTYQPQFAWNGFAYAGDVSRFKGGETHICALGYTSDNKISLVSDDPAQSRTQFTREATGFKAINNLDEATLGGWKVSGTPATTNYFEGTIDYVAITDEAISEQELRSFVTYKPETRTFSIALDAGEGSLEAEMPSVTKAASAVVLTIPEAAPTKAGSTFTGWTANGKSYQPGEPVILDANAPVLSLQAAYQDDGTTDPEEPDPVTLPVLQAKGRYQETVLSIERPQDDTKIYSILRAEEEGGTYAQVGTIDGSSYSFIDTGLTNEKAYFYKLQNGNTISNAAVTATPGKTAFIKNAEAHKTLAENEQSFDGSRTVSMSDQLDAVKDLEDGSIILRFKMDEAGAERYAFTASSSRNLINSGLPNANNLLYMGHNDKGQARVNINALRGAAGSNLSDGQWHTAVLASDTASGFDAYLAVDGNEILSFADTTGTNAKAFLKGISELDRLEIGGYTGASSVESGFKGDIEYVSISSQKLTKEQAKALSMESSANLRRDMFSNSTENTWLFVGGADTEGDFDQIGDIRPYSNQFEEFVRWDRRSDNGFATMRYVTNGAAAGNDLKKTIEKLDRQLQVVHPRAVVYLSSKEDLDAYANASDKAAWIAGYKADLKTLLDKATASDGVNTYLVLQTPYVTEDASNPDAQKVLADAMKDFRSSLSSELAGHVLIVDHSSQPLANSADQPTVKNGLLTGLGQYRLAKQFAQTVYGSSNFAWGEDYIDSHVLSDIPVYKALATAPFTADFTGADGLNVTLGSASVFEGRNYVLEAQGEDLKLTVPVEAGKTVTLPVSEGTWTLACVESNKNSRTQSYSISEGQTAASLVPVKMDEADKTELQKKVTALLESKTPLTWLFIGDSITHGALHTHGYDSITQNFQKYLDDPNGLNRPDDLVINTAVSGAKAVDTMTEPNLSARIKNYTPDIAILMLGMNDSGISKEQYKINMQANIDAVKEKNPNALLVLRICNTVPGRASVSNANDNYPQAIRELAQTNNAIVVDHAMTWDTYRSLYGTTASGGAANFNNNNLHPNGIGQRMMFVDLIQALGLYDESSTICTQRYDFATETSSTKPNVTSPQPGVIQVDLTSLAAADTIGTAEVTVTVDGIAYTKRYNKLSSASTTIVFDNLPKGKNAAADVTISNSSTKTIQYAQSDPVTITDTLAPFTAVLTDAKGGYSSVTLTMEIPAGKQVSVLRSESRSGTYTEIGTASESEYVDHSVSPEKTYFYKLKWTDTTDHETEVKEVQTGMDAYKASAEVYRGLKGESFDGAKVIELNAQEVSAIKNMPSGSIFFRIKTSQLADMAVISGKAAADTAVLYQSDQSSNIGLKNLNGTSVLRADLSHTRAEKAAAPQLNDDEWHNVVVVSNPGTSKTFCVYIDGKNIGFEFDGANNAGLLSKLSKMDQITIGGVKNGNTILGGFNGSIRDVIFSKEAFSREQGMAITAEKYVEDTEPEPEPELDKRVLKTTLDKAQALKGTFSNKDQAFTQAVTSAQTVYDTAAEQTAIDAAAKALNEKLLALRLVPSKDALASLS